jgi:hypothetical protein
LILAATPNSANSAFVQAELEYAKSLGIPMLPVWLGGDSWINFVPLAVSQAQYIDLRSGNYEENFNQLAVSLKKLEVERKPRYVLIDDAFDNSKAYGLGFGADPYIVVQLGNSPHQRRGRERVPKEHAGKAVLFNPDSYGSLQSLLDELYANYLLDRFEPLTYGARWFLSSERVEGRRSGNWKFGIHPHRIILPWEWLGSRQSTATSRAWPYWGRLPLAQYGMVAGSVCSIEEPDRPGDFDLTPGERAFGIAVNNDALQREIFEGEGKQPHPPYNAGFLDAVSYDSIDKREFRHLSIAMDPWAGQPYAGKVLKESEKAFDIKSLKGSVTSHRRGGVLATWDGTKWIDIVDTPPLSSDRATSEQQLSVHPRPSTSS